MQTLPEDIANMFQKEATKLRELHESIVRSMRTSFEQAVEAGAILVKVKRSKQMKHGLWMPWIASEVRVDHKTATDYMLAFKHQKQVRAKLGLNPNLNPNRGWQAVLRGLSKRAGSRVTKGKTNVIAGNVARSSRDSGSQNSGNGQNAPNEGDSAMAQNKSLARIIALPGLISFAKVLDKLPAAKQQRLLYKLDTEFKRWAKHYSEPRDEAKDKRTRELEQIIGADVAKMLNPSKRRKQ
jgi:hypothetical protein